MRQELGRAIAETRRELTGLRHDMLGGFAEIHRRFDRLEQGGRVIMQVLQRIEAGFADERVRWERSSNATSPN
jgi:hypothetical protein